MQETHQTILRRQGLRYSRSQIDDLDFGIGGIFLLVDFDRLLQFPGAILAKGNDYDDLRIGCALAQCGQALSDAGEGLARVGSMQHRRELRPFRIVLQAAAALSDSRRRHFNEEQMQTLAAEFDHAVGQEWSEKFRHTGVLMVCAVADELEGIQGTVENLRRWMTDADRFPAEWITAVEATLTHAQEQARPTTNESASAS